MDNIKERYISSYLPLVESFVKDLDAEQYANIPELFLPLFGKNFEHSKAKIAFVGRDTLRWGSMVEFIKHGQDNPKEALFRNLGEFQHLDFKGWMHNSGRNYWGFIYRVLSQIHGVSNWKDLPNGKRDDVLDQMAWGNTHALENFGATPKNEGASRQHYDELNKRSIPFKSFRHLYKVLEPDLVILMNWRASEARVAAGDTNCQATEIEKHIWYYFFPEANRHVIQVPHPTYIARSGKYDFDDFAKKVAQIAKDKLNG